MNLKKIKNQRKGQILFNFLEWLKDKKNYDNNQSSRMADPFFISDNEFDDLYKEFVKICQI